MCVLAPSDQLRISVDGYVALRVNIDPSTRTTATIRSLSTFSIIYKLQVADDVDGARLVEFGQRDLQLRECARLFDISARGLAVPPAVHARARGERRRGHLSRTPPRPGLAWKRTRCLIARASPDCWAMAALASWICSARRARFPTLEASRSCIARDRRSCCSRFSHSRSRYLRACAMAVPTRTCRPRSARRSAPASARRHGPA